MKRILRIMIGLPASPILMMLATYIWLWEDDDTTWKESIGYFTWYIASGNWDKLLD